MRPLIIAVLLLSLAACQTTANKQPPLETSNNPRHEKAEGKIRYRYPLQMVKKITSNLDTKISLTSGLFERYDPDTLAVIKNEIALFDVPGKSLPYLKYLREIKDQYEKKQITKVFKEFKRNPNLSRNHVNFLDKVLYRITNITHEEESQASVCMAEYYWNDLPANQKIILDKMAVGTNLTSEEVRALKKNPVASGSVRGIPITVKCTLVPMGLYSELRLVFRL